MAEETDADAFLVRQSRDNQAAYVATAKEAFAELFERQYPALMGWAVLSQSKSSSLELSCQIDFQAKTLTITATSKPPEMTDEIRRQLR